jgi:hypothetical protein
VSMANTLFPFFCSWGTDFVISYAMCWK